MKFTLATHKRWLPVAISLILFTSCNFLPESLADALSGASKPMATDGNSLFHQTDEISLKPGKLEILGEVKNPGKVNLNNHYKREVFIKESLFDPEHGVTFIGAYRYKGYSLFDLLHPFNHEKKNADIFRPAIDLYVEIANAKGESVVFSWSEIFHTNIPHQVLIATETAPIVPYRGDVDYHTGEHWRVVAANDLFAWRVLENPVSITVSSFDEKKYVIDRDLEPLHSPTIDVILENKLLTTINPREVSAEPVRYYSSFYGMGMGYHAAEYFEGPRLPDVLAEKLDLFNPHLGRHGLACFVGADGYRAIYSYSELFNRTDQVAAILAESKNPKDGGHYRIFHPSEFYADRSVKALKEIFIFTKQ